VTPDSYEAALSIAQTLSRNSPKAVALTKQLVLADRRKRILEFAAEVDRARTQVTQSPEYRELIEKNPKTVHRRVE
jgi:enoyl-CoA hydratase/carnithine racemase